MAELPDQLNGVIPIAPTPFTESGDLDLLDVMRGRTTPVESG